MSIAPADEPIQADPDQGDAAPAGSAQVEVNPADHAADAMKDQLRKDVASWREGRSNPQISTFSRAIRLTPPLRGREAIAAARADFNRCSASVVGRRQCGRPPSPPWGGPSRAGAWRGAAKC